jgi:hypothetical protein
MVRYSFLVRLFHPLLHAGLIPALSLITLSARTSTLGGIVRPICLAALRLITSSIVVGNRCFAGYFSFLEKAHFSRGCSCSNPPINSRRSLEAQHGHIFARPTHSKQKSLHLRLFKETVRSESG